MKIIKYILSNGLLALMLYLWFYYGIDGAKNIALFLIWATILISFFLLTEPVLKHLKEINYPFIPRWIDLSLDLVVGGVLLWHGYIITGSFWYIQILLLQAAIDKIKTKKILED